MILEFRISQLFLFCHFSWITRNFFLTFLHLHRNNNTKTQFLGWVTVDQPKYLRYYGENISVESICMGKKHG